MTRTGRPAKKSPERIAALLKALELGNTRSAACGVSDISLDTLARWMADDADFRGNVLKAEQKAEARYLGYVAAAAEDPKSWTAAAWWLERRHWQDYGRRERIEQTIEIRGLAEKVAAADGLDADVLLAEAERILATK